MDKSVEDKLAAVVRACVEMKGEELVVLDLRKLTTICDYFVICSGRSTIHVEAIADKLLEKMEEQQIAVDHVEGLPEARWVLVDMLDVVVHIFEPELREYYGLEQLWADAERVDVEQLVGAS